MRSPDEGRRFSRRLAPGLVLTVGLGASLGVFVLREGSVRHQARVRLESETDAIAEQLETTLDGYRTLLSATSADSTPEVSAPGLMAIAWATPRDDGSHGLRNVGFPAVEALAVEHAETPEMMAALGAARGPGDVTVSDDFGMAMPGGSVLPTFALVMRSAQENGSAVALVDASAFLARGSGEFGPRYAIEMWSNDDDGTAPAVASARLAANGEDPSGVARTIELVAFDRVWTLRLQHVRPLPDTTRTSLLILAAGVVATLLVSALVFRVARSEARAQRMVRDATAELARAEQHFRALVANASDLVTVVLTDGRLTYVSPAVTRLLGYGDDELVGANVLSFVHPDDVATLRTILADLTANPTQAHDAVVFRVRHADGSFRHLEATAANLLRDDAVRGIVLNSRDVTERVALQEHLATQATHDALTGLPNRTLLFERLSGALARASRSGARTGVLFVDLDRFKLVNDSLGHGAGDQLLVTVAERLKHAVRPGDTVARFGGDEFVVLAEGVEGEDECRQISARLAETLAAPFRLGGREVFVSASVGMTIADPRADTPETLLRDADAAMYRAKDEGRARSVFFHEEVHRRSVEQLEHESALRRALEREELVVQYQPQFDLASGAVVGVEAFLAWQHPRRGLLPGRVFFRAAEDTGLMVPFGAWVVREACLQGSRWTQHSGRRLHVCVNVSARQLADPDLVYVVRSALAESQLPAELLCLEITEAVLNRPDARPPDVLVALHELGVKIAIDDFGTGHASLAHLKRFPVDQLKIDASFVAGVGRDADDTVIVAAVIGLAHALGVTAVAEGVERDAQLEELRALRCDYAQGYLLARPGSADEVGGLLTHPAGAGEAAPAR